MECKSRSCREPRAQDHERCARHSSCSSTGTFIPDRCSICKPVLEKVLELPQESREEASEWLYIKNLFLASSALAKKLKKPELLWESSNLAGIFREPGKVATKSGSSRESSSSSNQNLAELTSVVKKLCEKLDKSFTNNGKGSPQKPSKRRRIESETGTSDDDDDENQQDKRRRTFIPPDVDTYAPSSEGIPSLDQLSDSRSLNQEMDSLKDQGWNSVPSHWQVWEQDCGSLAAFEPVQKEGDIVLSAIQNIDLKVIEFPENPVLLWRSRKSVGTVDQHRSFQKVKAVSNALSSLSTMLQIRNATAPRVSISDIKSGNISMSSSVPEASCCKFDTLSEWWKAKAIYPNAQPPSITENTPSTKINIAWPAESGHSKLSEFLSGSKISKSDFPKEFAPKDVEMISADNRARLLAQSAWQTSCSLDLLSSLLTACRSEADKDDKFDCKLVVDLAAKAVSGIAAFLAPHTQGLVEDAIDKRLKLRSSVISEKLKPVESKLLSAEPFSQKPCGSGLAFQEIANEAPKPLQVTLPPQVYKALTSNQAGQSRSFKGSSGGFFRRQSYNSQAKGRETKGTRPFFRQRDFKEKSWNKEHNKNEKGREDYNKKSNYNKQFNYKNKFNYNNNKQDAKRNESNNSGRSNRQQ